MDDLICEGLGDVLKECETLYVHVEPPESVTDHPAALILETNGAGTRAAYRGGWDAMVTVRMAVLVKPRVELAEAIQEARPWVRPILVLLSAYDELQADAADTPIAELKTVAWTVGQMAYAGQMWAAVDFEIVYQTDWQIAVSCDGIGSEVDL